MVSWSHGLMAAEGAAAAATGLECEKHRRTLNLYRFVRAGENVGSRLEPFYP